MDRRQACRRRDQLWQWWTDQMCVGLSLHVSAGYQRDLRYATNRAPQVRCRVADLPVFLPWLARYYHASAPDRALASAMAELPLIRQSLTEAWALISRKPACRSCFAADGVDQAVSHRRDLAKAVLRPRTRKPCSVTGDVLDAGDRGARAQPLTGESLPAQYIFPSQVSFPIPADWQKPIPRCSAARAAVSRWRRPDARTVRGTLATGDARRRADGAPWSWWRWEPWSGGLCPLGYSIRSTSSAAIICI